MGFVQTPLNAREQCWEMLFEYLEGRGHRERCKHPLLMAPSVRWWSSHFLSMRVLRRPIITQLWPPLRNSRTAPCAACLQLRVTMRRCAPASLRICAWQYPSPTGRELFTNTYCDSTEADKHEKRMFPHNKNSCVLFVHSEWNGLLLPTIRMEKGGAWVA